MMMMQWLAVVRGRSFYSLLYSCCISLLYKKEVFIKQWLMAGGCYQLSLRWDLISNQLTDGMLLQQQLASPNKPECCRRMFCLNSSGILHQ
jgi:hypothetical protein